MVCTTWNCTILLQLLGLRTFPPSTSHGLTLSRLNKHKPRRPCRSKEHSKHKFNTPGAQGTERRLWSTRQSQDSGTSFVDSLLRLVDDLTVFSHYPFVGLLEAICVCPVSPVAALSPPLSLHAKCDTPRLCLAPGMDRYSSSQNRSGPSWCGCAHELVWAWVWVWSW